MDDGYDFNEFVEDHEVDAEFRYEDHEDKEDVEDTLFAKALEDSVREREQPEKKTLNKKRQRTSRFTINPPQPKKGTESSKGIPTKSPTTSTTKPPISPKEPSKSRTEILGSYIPLTDKTKYKMDQPVESDIFRTDPNVSTPGPTSKVFIDSTKLAKRNLNKAGQDSHLVTSTPPTMDMLNLQKTKTIIVNKIGDLNQSSSPTATVVREPLIGNPNLFTVRMDVLTGYQSDREQAESETQKAIFGTVKAKLTGVKKEDLSFSKEEELVNERAAQELTPNKPIHKIPTSATSDNNKNEFLNSHMSRWLKLHETMKSHFTIAESDIESYVASSSSHSSSSVPKLSMPNIEMLPRSYVVDLLRAPSKVLEERPCMFGDKCESHRLWNIKNTKYSIKERNRERAKKYPEGKKPYSLPEAPFACREFFLPSEDKYIRWERSKGRPTRLIMADIPRRCCLLCNRYATDQFSNLQKSEIERKQSFIVQSHGNLCNQPGEYIQEVMRSSCYEDSGIYTPSIGYDVEHYELGNVFLWTKRNSDNVDYDTGAMKDEPPPGLIPKKLSAPDYAEIDQDHYTTLIPSENEVEGSKASNKLVRDVCKILNADSAVYTEVIPGWLEIEDIIYQPAVNDVYVKTVNEASKR